MKPCLIIEPRAGRHNLDENSLERVLREKAYADLSTVCVIVTRGLIHARVVQTWMGMILPMNQKFTRIFISGMEVGSGYEAAFDYILQHPELSKWNYILTLEEDNMPPMDGLLRLYESTDKFDVISGLYWTKGEEGQPMIYGDPTVEPITFMPQPPTSNSVQECNGVGMGFTLFKTTIFKDSELKRPWFKTVTGTNGDLATQDLYFCKKLRELNYRIGVDTRVKVGHFDVERELTW